MNFDVKMPVNWFDVLVLILLFVGVQRGRKHGMSKELLAVLKWLTIVVVGAFTYEPFGDLIASQLKLSKLFSFIIAYVTAALVVTLVFNVLNRTLAPKLDTSDAFGKGEFYLAMGAGMMRFACAILVGMALLNARYYRTAEIKEMQKFQMDNYGSEFFPTLQSIQESVMEKSFTGPHLKKYIGFVFIKPTPAMGGSSQTANSFKRKEFTLP